MYHIFSSLVGVTNCSIWFTYGFKKLPYDVSGFQAILNSYKWTTNVWQTACITRAECLQAECLKPPSFSPRYPCDNRPPPWGAKMCFFSLILKCVSVCEKRLRIITQVAVQAMFIFFAHWCGLEIYVIDSRVALAITPGFFPNKNTVGKTKRYFLM